MRPRALVASAALTAVLAMVALPQIVGSATPGHPRAVEAAAFQVLAPTGIGDGGEGTIRQLDAAHRSANALVVDATFTEPGADPNASASAAGRVSVAPPRPVVHASIKPPLYSISGYASWYVNGTTAMRLPYGTIVRICGAGGCVERTVTDFGPSAAIRPIRVVDMMPGDFASVCGCGAWRGTTFVRVDVY